MHPQVLEHRRWVGRVRGRPAPASSIQGLPGYEEARLAGWSGVAAVALRHRVKYLWMTLRPGCTRPEVYRQTEFMAVDEPPVCHAIFKLHKRDLLENLIRSRYEEPEVVAKLCQAVREFAWEARRNSWGRALLMEVEVESTTVLSYDWVRWWWLVPCALPAGSTSAAGGYPIQALEMEVYAEDEKRGAEACPICLEDFVPGAQVERLPCRHRFHGECLLRWLEGEASCPMCRCEFRLK